MKHTIAAATVPPGPPRTDTGCSIFPSDLGWMAAEWRGDRLARLTFDHDTPAQAAEAIGVPPWAGGEPACAGELVRRLQAFASGTPDDLLDIPLWEDHWSEFQQRVVYFCRRIRRGTTASYQELAALAGSPGAARAVGNTMARNRFPLIVPCHRVVGASGKLGGYSSPHGLATKRRLLALEGVPPFAAC